MIKNNAVLTFGKGDIGINTGLWIEDGKTLSIVTFNNQTPREIGLNNGDIKAGTRINLADVPVVMKFDNAKSIDTLIHSLVQAKRELTNSLESDKEDNRLDQLIEKYNKDMRSYEAKIKSLQEVIAKQANINGNGTLEMNIVMDQEQLKNLAEEMRNNIEGMKQIIIKGCETKNIGV